jgi:hypothetical protein
VSVQRTSAASEQDLEAIKGRGRIARTTPSDIQPGGRAGGRGGGKVGGGCVIRFDGLSQASRTIRPVLTVCIGQGGLRVGV